MNDARKTKAQLIEELAELRLHVMVGEALKKGVIESAIDCVIVMDHEGKIVEFNPAAERTFGYTRQEVVGQSLSEKLIPPAHREQHEKGLRHFLVTGEGPVLGKRIEITALRADGTEFPVDLAIAAVAMDGPPVFTASLQDTTERSARERQERALQQMRQAIWSLDSTSQVQDILLALQRALKTIGIPHRVCGVNLIDDNGAEVRVVFHNLIEGEIWRSGDMIPKDVENIIAFQRGGTPVYRPDLLADNPFRDLHVVQRTRSIIDVPFTHGTLAFNSIEPNAFDGYIPVLEEIASVLSEAFRRLDNLQVQIQGQVMEGMVEGVLVVDTHGIITSTNSAFDAMFGYERGELNGQNVAVLNDLPEEENIRFSERVISQIKSEGFWRGEFSNLKKDGASFTTFARISLLEYEGKQYMVSVQEDITESKLAQRELEEQRRYLDSIHENVGINIWIVEPDEDGVWRYRYVTRNFERAVGISPERIYGKTPQECAPDIITPEQGERMAREWYKCIASGQPHTYEEHMTIQGREDKWWQSTLSPVKDGNGNIYRMIYSAIEITERKRAEIALRESEVRYRRVVEDQTEFLVRWLPDGTRTFVNESYCHYFGLTREACIGASFFPLLAEEDLERVHRKIENITPENPTATEEHRVTLPDGRTGWNRWTDRGLFDNEGNIIEYQSVGRDITDRKKAEEELEKSQKMLEEERLQTLRADRLRSLGEMAAGVAHELNQPLAGISATSEDVYIRLLEDMPLEQAELKDMMRDSLSLVERMTDTINHLRIFSRDTTDEPHISCSLNETIQSSLKLIHAQLRNHSISLELELAEELPPLMGHFHQLEQVFLNLVVNARDALDERADSREKHLWIRTRRHSEQWVAAEIEDNGIGMDAETAERVFEPFFTTKRADRGTGLGLSISHSIVQDHGGQLTCESRPAEGTTFQVKLPLAKQVDW